MPKLFELFGYHVGDKSEEAELCRREARCPFMNADCDGGGNRFASHISFDAGKHPQLAAFFVGRTIVPSGVCSIQMRNDEAPWIVCPRRLLNLKEGAPGKTHQEFAESLILRQSGCLPGTVLGVWPELKIKYTDTQTKNSFDYTFDYVLMPVAKASEQQVEEATGKRWTDVLPVLEKEGYAITRQDGKYYVDDFPIGAPLVIEIMTSSTSGGNKAKRTTVPMAFEDAILGKPHEAPGINYRQVWARMVSQLIVKSEVGLAWGGKTFWIVQDALVDYISKSTALDIRQFLAQKPDEVNMVTLSYGGSYRIPSGVMELNEGCLYAGPISPPGSDRSIASFQDIVRTPLCPPKELLVNLLMKRKYLNVVIVPGENGQVR